MPNIVACYKWVLDDADIRITDDLSVDTGHARRMISEFDKSAVEAAVRLASAMEDGHAVALSFGGADVAKSNKDVLSRGSESGLWVNSADAEGADSRATAKALAAGIGQVGDVSVVVCAEGASDTYARQVGPRLGAVLDWPVVTSVVEAAVDGDAVVAKRKLEDEVQTVRVQMPAVLCVLPEGFEPRVPGLKDIMKAGKKPFLEVKAEELGADLAPRVETGALAGVANERKSVMVEGEGAQEVAQALADAIKREGVL